MAGSRGIEPPSPAWQAGILTTELRAYNKYSLPVLYSSRRCLFVAPFILRTPDRGDQLSILWFATLRWYCIEYSYDFEVSQPRIRLFTYLLSWIGGRGGDRTHVLLINSQLLQPTELQGHIILLITQSINWSMKVVLGYEIPVSIKLLVTFAILVLSF